jgi:radical SAM superfamily enzyme YgiQ (UPF0313 family)
MPKKVLLIHPTYAATASHTLVYRKGYGTAVPLGLGYVAAELLRHGHRVAIYDFQVEKRDLQSQIEKYQPDLFGITVTTPAANAAVKIAEQIKKRYPHRPIIAGGPHISTLKSDVLIKTPAYDYLVVGEGERTIIELTEAIDGQRPLQQVNGIIYRNGNRVVETEPRAFIPNLDQLPPIPLGLFRYREYIPTPGTFTYLPSVAFLSSRGCPFKCVFCNKSMFGNTIRQMSAPRMVDEIIEMQKRHGIKEICFYDDTFTVNTRRIFSFCDLLMRRKVNIRWKCNSRVDTVSRQMLLTMKKAGCAFISFGVESGDDRILEKIKKGITTDQVRNAFRWSKEAGIATAAFFMLNLPGDTQETIKKTIRFAKEIKPDYVSFEMTKPLPGTQIKSALAEESHLRIKEDLWSDWDSCTTTNKVFYTQNDLTEAYLQNAFSRAVKSYYLTPSYILKSLRRLRTWAQFKSYLAAAVNILLAKVGVAL